MAKAGKRSALGGPAQGDLFDLGGAVEEGSLDLAAEIRSAMVKALRDTSYSRWDVASRMSEVLGKDVTKSMLDAWCAETKEGHRFPLEFLAAFCWATGSTRLLAVGPRALGHDVVGPEDASLLQIARMEAERAELDRRISILKTKRSAN